MDVANAFQVRGPNPSPYPHVQNPTATLSRIWHAIERTNGRRLQADYSTLERIRGVAIISAQSQRAEIQCLISTRAYLSLSIRHGETHIDIATEVRHAWALVAQYVSTHFLPHACLVPR